MTAEGTQIQHKIIVSGDQKFIAEVDPRGEIVKTWEANEGSEVFLAELNLKKAVSESKQ